MKTIGQRIKFLRKQHNFTVQQLAELINKTKGNISSYENGKYEPSAQTIIRICEIFNISIDWLLTGKEFGNKKISIMKENNELNLTDEEKNLIIIFRNFSEEDKELIKIISDNLLKRLKKTQIYIPMHQETKMHQLKMYHKKNN